MYRYASREGTPGSPAPDLADAARETQSSVSSGLPEPPRRDTIETSERAVSLELVPKSGPYRSRTEKRREGTYEDGGEAAAARRRDPRQSQGRHDLDARWLRRGNQDRPEISVLSDEFLDSIATKTEHPNVQIRLLEKLLKGEVRSRSRTNRTQAKLFSDEIEAVLRRYELRQISSAEVVERLVEIAKSLRDARRRHEQLGLTIEEAAFYDALAGGSSDGAADPQLAMIASELVKSIRADLTVDWADRESTEAKIRTKIKRLLRKHGYKPPTLAGGGGGADAIGHYTQLVLDQAKELYRYWPDVEDRLFG
jgi:Domain of unknown function (DUF3387)